MSDVQLSMSGKNLRYRQALLERAQERQENLTLFEDRARGVGYLAAPAESAVFVLSKPVMADPT